MRAFFGERGLRKRVTALPLRRWAMFGIQTAVMLTWLIYVLVAGELDRAIDNWESAVTMIFGSFIAGSSPGGAGVVAFPVLTKVLDVPAEIARSFTLSTQALGMTCAACAIVLARRHVEWRALVVGLPVGTAGFLIFLFLLGEPDRAFWPSTLSAGLIKVTFTLLLAAMAVAMLLLRREDDMGQQQVPHWNRRVWGGIVLMAFVGGGISAWTGAGVNVLVFLFLVVMAGLHPRVGIPTSVLLMAGISIVGLVTLGFLDGQFDIGLSADGERVIALEGRAFGPVEASRYDLRGLWLAAIPIVAWGAPLGTWVVTRLREDLLVTFLGLAALVEVVSTFALVDQLHHDTALLAYAIVGLVVAVAGVVLLRRHRVSILGLPVDGDA